MLEWLGDIGGLFDAFRWIGYLLVTPIASMKVKELVMQLSFYQDDEEAESPENNAYLTQKM